MPLPLITPADARRLIENGAVLVDVREPAEYAREHIPGAVNRALGTLDGGPVAPGAPAVVFHCKSDGRTRANADRLAAAAGADAYILGGGIDAWRAAGLPTKVDRRQPIDIMRQVQIAAGSLIVAGGALGFLVDPAWFWLPVAVGAGLVFAGVSGTCGMASLLRRMPWNRVAAQ
ncbi:MAG: rhodanese family protein [Rhodospirillales bacterium]